VRAFQKLTLVKSPTKSANGEIFIPNKTHPNELSVVCNYWKANFIFNSAMK